MRPHLHPVVNMQVNKAPIDNSQMISGPLYSQIQFSPRVCLYVSHKLDHYVTYLSTESGCTHLSWWWACWGWSHTRLRGRSAQCCLSCHAHSRCGSSCSGHWHPWWWGCVGGAPSHVTCPGRCGQTVQCWWPAWGACWKWHQYWHWGSAQWENVSQKHCNEGDYDWNKRMSLAGKET